MKNEILLQNKVTIELPAMLNIPPKLYPLITDFDKYRYFLFDGGRNGGKSQAVGRWILYLGDQYNNMNIVCGREVQNKIEESVYTLLKEIIKEFNLPYLILSNEIRHFTNGTTITFKGFRDQSAENIKGLQGVDILWVDEAQALSKRSVENIIPTIRKDTSKLIFTMNRFMVSDAIYDDMVGRADCLHIQINYNENPFCPLSQKAEAEVCRERSIKDFNHIWLGMPLPAAEDYLFDASKLYKSYEIEAAGDLFHSARVLAIDFAAQGNDSCVATILDRQTNQHWKLTTRLPWDEPDPMVSVGRIVALIGQYKPDITVLDVGGMGHVVWARLNELGLDIKRFDGGSTDGVDTLHYANARAEGYYILREWFDNSFMMMDKKDEIVIKQLERIRMKYRSNGTRLIQAKADMRKEGYGSPDDADSLMMAVWGAVKHLGKSSTFHGAQTTIKRITRSRR